MVVKRLARRLTITSRPCVPEQDLEGSYIIPIDQVRFSNGEGKVRHTRTVRGRDIYILADVGNYSCTYRMFGFETHMGPDEHLQDIKRVISAIAGKANRVTLMMPLLYSSRQHKRKERESLDWLARIARIAAAWACRY